MKKSALLFLVLASANSMALNVLSDGPVNGETIIPAEKYLKFKAETFGGLKEAPSEPQVPGLPVKSKLQPGIFGSYQLSECQKYPAPLFVLGADEASIAWLKANRKHLKAVNAIGFVTNIEDKDALKDIEAILTMPLIPAKVDSLIEALHVPAYPFFTNGCEVWQ